MESLECFSTPVEEAGADTAEAVQQAGAVNLDGQPVPISAVAADGPVPSTHHLGSHPTAVRGGVLKHTPWCHILWELPTALRLGLNPPLRAQEASALAGPRCAFLAHACRSLTCPWLWPYRPFPALSCWLPSLCSPLCSRHPFPPTSCSQAFLASALLDWDLDNSSSHALYDALQRAWPLPPATIAPAKW